MIEPATLARKSDAAPSDFAVLKREGLRLVQEFSGGRWTDYNLHDPGVTILDQLCYGITELIYRAGLPMEDFLADGDGAIDPSAQALHSPDKILPSRPVTGSDLRKVIFLEVPEVEDAWVERVQEGGVRGLLKVEIALRESYPEREAVQVLERVRRAFCRSRNLCEDLVDVTVAPQLLYELHGAVEIGGAADPADVMARIYHDCSMKVADGIKLLPFSQALREGKSLDEILNGPFSGYGLAENGEFDGGEMIRIADLFAIVGALPGVEKVRELYLARGEQRFYDCITGNRVTLRLETPEGGREPRLILTREGREVAVSPREVRAKFDELHFRHRSMRRVQQDLSVLTPQAFGTPRDLRDYYSIQNHFPQVYGVNTSGVPVSAPADLKGKVAQLKGYLLLFEQLMANFNADLAHLGTLFSVREGVTASYTHQLVQNDGSPPLSELYRDGAQAALAAIVSNHDSFEDRRSRLLDYLIALYGESFPAQPFRHYDWYALPGEGEKRLIAAKSSYLGSIVELGQDRGAGLDYLDTCGDSSGVCGLTRRLSFLLGFGAARPGRAASGVLREKMVLVPDEELLRRLPLLYARREGEGETWGSIPLAPQRMTADREAQRKEASFILPTARRLLAVSLLRRGFDLRNFRVVAGRRECRLLFTPDGELSWWDLARYAGVIQAFRGANLLSRFLAAVNEEAEGVHVVEHVLLRPKSGPRRNGPPNDFYSFRVSVVFPGWTARCSDPGFREQAEDLAVENCPAHVFPRFYWLEWEEMSIFEDLFQKWLQVLATSSSIVEHDRAAEPLVAFLLEKEER